MSCRTNNLDAIIPGLVSPFESSSLPALCFGVGLALLAGRGTKKRGGTLTIVHSAGVHEGVLKGSGGHLIVGSVSPEVYRRIEEHVRKGAGAPDPSKPEIVAAATTS